MSVMTRAGRILERQPGLWPVSAALMAFAAGIAVISPPFVWLGGHMSIDFTMAIWHLSWLANGFIKRGLPGTIVKLLGLTAEPDLIWVVHYLATAAAAMGLGAIAANSTRRLGSAERLAVLVLLALSPALLLHAGLDVGRLTPILILALFAGAQLYAESHVLAATVVLLVAGLVHEVVVLVGGALLGVLALDRLMRGPPLLRIEWVKNVAAALALLSLLAATSNTPRPSMLVEAYHSAAPYVENREILRGALWWFTAPITMNIRENLCHFREYPLRWVYLGITLAFIAAHVPALFGPFGRPRTLLAGLLAMKFALLAFLALDMGRWAALVIAAFWAYFLVLVAREERFQFVPGRSSVLILAAFYVLGPMGIYATLLVPQVLLPRLMGVAPHWGTISICKPSMTGVMF